MGIDYIMANHSNATYYEVGRGDWFLFDSDKWTLYDVELLFGEIREMWEDNHDISDEYVDALAKDLCKFVGEAQEDEIEVLADGGDDQWMLRSIGYVCVGSRYNLLDPEENKKNIVSENSWTHEKLGDREIEKLKQRGWNLKNYRPA